MSITSIGTYAPVWQTKSGRVAGPDEDVLTMAVSAASAALEATSSTVTRLILVTATPDLVDGIGVGVALRSLELDESTPTEVRLGGAPATIEALLAGGPGALVIGVDASPSSASAAAALLADGPGLELTLAGRRTGSLPMRIRRVGAHAADVYLDARVERELASAPLMELLGGSGPVYAAGLPSAVAQKLGAAKTSVTATGAAAPILLLAELADEAATVRVVGLDTASGVGVDFQRTGPLAVRRDERSPIPATSRPVDRSEGTVVPFSMPAYARAFDAKIGMQAARCECGEVSFPPRLVCLACDRYDQTAPIRLERTGEVYTAVTVHVPIPGIAGKYTLVIVSVTDSPIRVLARLTDSADVDVPIGASGRLVLRKVAEREGIPDYGYAFQLDTTEGKA